MNFTREPIIETIITPKEGYKLLLRNSKGTHAEEFFVEAVQVISFGTACFYRSLEKPKNFLLPVGDYEVVETRETRIALKTPGVEKGGIKIGGGKETPQKLPREGEEVPVLEKSTTHASIETGVPSGDAKDKRKERRRLRKRRGKSEVENELNEEETETLDTPFTDEREEEPRRELPKKEERASLIPPPSTLISETLARYKDTPGFANAFFEKKEESEAGEEETSNPRLLIEESPGLQFLEEESVQELPQDDEDDLT